MARTVIEVVGRFGDAVTASALTLSTCVEADVAAKRVCSIEGCGKPHKGYGLCNMHYQRLKSGYSLTAPHNTTREQTDAFYAAALLSKTDECIIWPFSCNQAGYAVRRRGAGSHMVSRQICEAVNGPPEPRMTAAHNCGRGDKGCVNPRHVRWATMQENAYDKYAHGTMLLGLKNHQAKLDDDSVVEILHLLKSGKSQLAIAGLYGVSQTTISDVATGKSWVHVPRRAAKK